MTSCCKPRVYAGPSGVRMRHAWDCKRSPGEVYVSPVVDLDRARLARRHSAGTRRAGLDDAIATHPAGGVLTATDERCPLHRLFLWDECPECSDRRTS